MALRLSRVFLVMLLLETISYIFGAPALRDSVYDDDQIEAKYILSFKRSRKIFLSFHISFEIGKTRCWIYFFLLDASLKNIAYNNIDTLK